MFDLIKFLKNKYDGKYEYEWYTKDNTEYNIDKEELEFPIRKIYKFYPWEDMAIGYFLCRFLSWKVYNINNYTEIENDEMLKEETKKWCKLINKEEKLFIPEILEKIIKIEKEKYYKKWEKNQ